MLEAVPGPFTCWIRSSSFAWMATESRFCVFWMRKTMMKVTIVVVVLITNCHVSLNLNTGPVMAHPRMRATAAMNAHGLPAPRLTTPANDEKTFFTRPG